MRHLFAAALIALVAVPAAAQDVVRVRGGDHDDYGRMVFDWDKPVQYRVGLADGQLQVEFARKATFATSPLFPALNDYVGKPAPGPHGYRMTFPLKGSYDLKHWTSGSKVVIDLQRLQAEPQQQAAPVRLRVGQHAGFGRLVFDWPNSVDYTVERQDDGSTATVRFNRDAALDLSGYADRPPKQVLALAPLAAADGSGVELQIPAGAKLRDFTDGPKVVVDVIADQAQVAAAKESPKPEPKPEPEMDAAQSSQSQEPKADDAAEMQDEAPAKARAAEAEPVPRPDGAQADRQQAGQDDAGAPTPLTPEKVREAVLAAQQALKDGQGEAAPDADGAAAAKDAETAAKPKATEGGDATTDSEAEASMAEPADATVPEADPEMGSERRYTPQEIAAGVAPEPGRVPPRSETASLELGWAKRAAAAFRHGGALWFVAEGTAPDSFAAKVGEAVGGLDDVELRHVGDATVIRLTGRPALRAVPRQESGTWHLDLAPRPALPTRPIPVKVENGAARLPVEVAGTPVELKDPATGGRLVVVPLAATGQGVASARNYPEFGLPKTTMGVAVQPRADDVRVRVADDAVVVDAPKRKLALSAGGGQGTGQADMPPEGQRLLHLDDWRRPDESFTVAKQGLQRQVAQAAPGERHLARLALARFYFAHGMGAETLGALDLYAKETPRRRMDPQVRLMKGAAHVLDGNWRQAGENLAHPSLDGAPEARPWRAAYATAVGADAAAVTGFQKSDGMIQAYAPSVRKRLRLWAAEARLAQGQTDGAERELDAVRELEPNAAEQAQIDYLEARRHLLMDEPEKAEELWRKVTESTHPPARSRARFVMVERDLAADRVDRDEAVAKLERLRFAWRGDQFEAVLLDRLADLYIEGDEYRRALTALRQVASHLPDTARAKRAAERMRNLFSDLFLDGAADQMPPLKALALYESFRELTPAGQRGDEMISRLADRLVGVDLLDRAAELLDAQVQHRLSGTRKAEVGARLASIYLLDRRPEKALEALDISDEAEPGDELGSRRRHLRARALADSDRPADALALLEADSSPDSLRLKAEIHGEAGEWEKAVADLRKLVPGAPADGEAFGREQADKVLRLAVAQTLAGDRAGLKALDADYGKAMAESQHAETFRLLAGRTGSGITSVAEQLARVSQAQAFMSSYRDSLQQQAQLPAN